MNPARWCILLTLLGISSACIRWSLHSPEPELLSFRIGQTFEEVVKNSTFAVMETSLLPSDDPTGFGATYVTEPAVIIHFNDAKHGFTLPPTNFAALTYQHNTAAMIATSPMLRKASFSEAVAILESLQDQFKAAGWEPWSANDSDWFDLSTEGKRRLYHRMFEPGHMQAITLRVPKKYGMTFRLKCVSGCWSGKPPYHFLIDIGISDDIEGWEPGDPMIWEKSHPAARATATDAGQTVGC